MGFKEQDKCQFVMADKAFFLFFDAYGFALNKPLYFYWLNYYYINNWLIR